MVRQSLICRSTGQAWAPMLKPQKWVSGRTNWMVRASRASQAFRRTDSLCCLPELNTGSPCDDSRLRLLKVPCASQQISLAAERLCMRPVVVGRLFRAAHKHSRSLSFHMAVNAVYHVAVTPLPRYDFNQNKDTSPLLSPSTFWRAAYPLLAGASFFCFFAGCSIKAKSCFTDFRIGLTSEARCFYAASVIFIRPEVPDGHGLSFRCTDGLCAA